MVAINTTQVSVPTQVPAAKAITIAPAHQEAPAQVDNRPAAAALAAK